MVFGIFDGLHEGHIFFLKQASKCGDLLIVVGRDSSAIELKGKRPRQKQVIRVSNIHKLKLGEVVLGDENQCSYGVVKKFLPDVICLGYDQKELKNDLKMKMREKKLPKIALLTLRPYKPAAFHKSRFNV